jgi:hypothetical protein
MRKRTLNVVLVALAGLMFLAVGALTAADVPDQVSIENKGYKEDKKGPVNLTHKKHVTVYKVACTECHHEFKDGKNIWKEGMPVKKCSACHDFEAKKGNADKLQNAYHKNCKDCHKALVEAGKSQNAPFKKCTECHKGA